MYKSVYNNKYGILRQISKNILTMAGLVFIIVLLTTQAAYASETVHYEFTIGAGAVNFTKDPVLKSFYQKKNVPAYNLGMSVIFYHFVGIDASLGFVYGKHIIYAQPGVGEQYVLMVYPARLDAVLQLRMTDDQPIYPYIGGGGTATGFYQVRSSDGKTVSGYKYGLNFIAGIHFLLDPIDMRHVGMLRTGYGIDHVYLDIRFGHDSVNNFGGHGGFDLSDQYISGAIGFEF